MPLLLNSLLRQVEATVDQKDPMNEPKPPREDMLDPSIGEYLDIKLRQLGLKSPEVKVSWNALFYYSRTYIFYDLLDFIALRPFLEAHRISRNVFFQGYFLCKLSQVV